MNLENLIWPGIYVCAALIGLLFGYMVARRLYSKGQLAGWKRCEKMVMDRAEENSNYNSNSIWAGLLQ